MNFYSKVVQKLDHYATLFTKSSIWLPILSATSAGLLKPSWSRELWNTHHTSKFVLICKIQHRWRKKTSLSLLIYNLCIFQDTDIPQWPPLVWFLNTSSGMANSSPDRVSTLIFEMFLAHTEVQSAVHFHFLFQVWAFPPHYFSCHQ